MEGEGGWRHVLFCFPEITCVRHFLDDENLFSIATTHSQPPSYNICPTLAYIPRKTFNTSIPKGMVNFPPSEQFSISEAFQPVLNLLLSYFLAALGFNLPNLADNYRAGRQIL